MGAGAAQLEGTKGGHKGGHWSGRVAGLDPSSAVFGELEQWQPGPGTLCVPQQSLGAPCAADTAAGAGWAGSALLPGQGISAWGFTRTGVWGFVGCVRILPPVILQNSLDIFRMTRFDLFLL